MVQILIADDEPFVRRGLKQLLDETSPGWRIVAEATDTAQALIMARIATPDLAIVDPDLDRGAGLQLCRRLSNEGVAVVIYYEGPGDPLVLGTFRAAGALFSVNRSAPLPVLVDAIRKLSATIHANRKPAREAGTLTKREFQIARLLADGYRNKDIASKLRLSTRTIEAHRESVRRKLGVDSIGDLALLFAATGSGEYIGECASIDE